MTVLLGITDGDDSGAALLEDGRIVAAVNEERLNRIKLTLGFPRQAIEEVLRLSGKGPDDIDGICMAAFAEPHVPEAGENPGWLHETSAVQRIRNEISSVLAKPLGQFQVVRGAYKRLKRLTLGNRRSGVQRLLKEMGLRAPITYHEHHRCHAIAAFDASGFDEAVSISLDGGGDGCSSHVYSIDAGGERYLHKLDSFDSIGNFYAYVTHLCGFRAARHEGKITGLSAHGEPFYKGLFERLIAYRDGSIKNIGRVFHRSAINTLRRELPAEWEHRDLASSIQTHLEDVAVKYVQHWIRQSGKSKVCLSGGVFANVLLNQRIADLPEVDGVFVLPPMGDGGLASGAAFSEFRNLNGGHGPGASVSRFPHVYLGPSYSDDEIERVLKRSGLEYRRYDDIEDAIARLIHEGRVVARFNGAMEYGPRALGNRTILYKTDDPRVNDWLNKRLDRTEFMPFAPAVLAGEEEKLFHWNPASARAARYMTITLDCSDWMKERCPAVVHIDGTARPQVVDKETNPSFHRVIERYAELSGVPVVVNTSFNMHEEPIVRTPADAIRSYQRGRLDNLAVGSFLLGPEPQAEA